MEAIILAAGHGRRMGSSDVNKVTLPLAGQPVITYIVGALRKVGIQDIIVVVGFQKESIEKILGDSVTYVEQKERLGTAHAVTTGMEKVGEDADDVLIVNGDSSAFYTDDILKEIISVHEKEDADVTLMTVLQVNPTGGRIVRENGKITDMVEDKDAAPAQRAIKEIGAGCYLVKREVLADLLPKIEKSSITGEYYLTSLIGLAVQAGKKVSSVTIPETHWHEVNTPDEYKSADKRMRSRAQTI